MKGFAAALERWYLRHKRDLPWRATRDPYRIWVSEIMLQQTRAQAVKAYYHRFLKRFPSVQALAEAPEAEVLACWSGLGYYSRARNLQRGAQRIVEAGRFPRAYDAIRELPGVGPYTAAALASIVFGLPHAVLDGNVMRVIARLTNDAADIGSAKTRARFQAFAQDVLLDRKNPGRFNQAMMELGATVCVPRAPLCGSCPVSPYCEARRQGAERQLPVKLRKIEPQRIERAVAVVRRNASVLLWQRNSEASRMAGFWELPEAEQLPGIRILENLGSFRHSITHHRYVFTVVAAALARRPKNCEWVRADELLRIPLSTTARKALRLVYEL